MCVYCNTFLTENRVVYSCILYFIIPDGGLLYMGELMDILGFLSILMPQITTKQVQSYHFFKKLYQNMGFLHVCVLTKVVRMWMCQHIC